MSAKGDDKDAALGHLLNINRGGLSGCMGLDIRSKIIVMKHILDIVGRGFPDGCYSKSKSGNGENRDL
jgi:hypothetical protein